MSFINKDFFMYLQIILWNTAGAIMIVKEIYVPFIMINTAIMLIQQYYIHKVNLKVVDFLDKIEEILTNGKHD